jgi:conjugal transfer pilus assembly protein TraW
MKRAALLIAAAGSLLGAALLEGASPSAARDYGAAGQTFPIIEPDLLATIEARLKRAEASGELARMNEVFARRVEAKVKRPDPVAGITPAQEVRTWDFDPSVAIDHDVRDHKGNLIAAAGQQVNPLDFVTIRQDLVFVDGDNAAELVWATARYSDSKAKIIFVSGSPIEQMTARKRRFYFDQAGKLTGRFGISHTPAVVTQAGRVMRVTEHVLGKGRAL